MIIMSQGSPTDKEVEAYAQAFIDNGNDQVKAWRVAFPDSDANLETQYPKASRMHKMDKVQARIVQLECERAAIARERFSITTEGILKRLAIESGYAGEHLIPDDSTQSGRVSALKQMAEHTGGFDANKQKVELKQVSHEDWLDTLQ